MRTATRATLIILLAAGGAAGGYVYYYGLPPVMAQDEQAQQGQQEEPPAPVVLAEVGQEDIQISVEAVGDTIARESVILTSRVSGRVTTINFTDGQDINAGDIVVQLDPADAEDALQGAVAAAEEAAQAFERASQLAESGSGPQAVSDDLFRQAQVAQSQVESARERLQDYNIRAPFGGRLGLRNISLGALIQPGTEIATLDAIDPIEIRFSVPERYLGQVVAGASVTAITPAFPDESFEGEVTAIASRIDPALRTLTLEASVPNPDGRLLPGMLMNVTLSLGVREDAIVAPPLAVQLQGDVQFVYRVTEGKAERVEVQIGQRNEDQVEITEGIEAGERVIVEGFQDLTSGQAVAEQGQEQAEPAAAAAATPQG